MSSAALILVILTTCCTFQLLFAIQMVAGPACKRKCVQGEPSMTCHFEFNLEMYASMSGECAGCPSEPEACFKSGCIPADGRSKALYLVNRQLPGPPIEVCKGDRVIVDLRNNLPTETTTIHWHGLHQRQSPFMDGVPYVTQCPIPPGNSFRYDFVADLAGSYIWHSHANDQRADGMFGPLVVRAPLRRNPLRRLYQRDEHVVMINDWTNQLFSSAFTQFIHESAKVEPHTILINGLARNNNDDNNNSSIVRMPSATFDVEKGYNYRFRFMNAGVHDCSIEVNIDNHTMLVVSADGRDIEPIEVDAVRILSGERYDVIVSATEPVDNYWMRFRGKDGQVEIYNIAAMLTSEGFSLNLNGSVVTPKEKSGSACDRNKVHQVAILRYKGAPVREPTGQVGFDIPSAENRKVLNPFNKGQESPDAISIPTLNSLENDDPTSVLLNHRYFIAFDYINLDERAKKLDEPNVSKPRTMWQLNHINFKAPPFPLLTQSEMIEPNQFCNYTKNMKHCLKEYCSCTHTLNAELNSIIELVLVDEGKVKINHPIHLHGYHFRIVAMEKLNETTTLEEVKRMSDEGRIKIKLSRAPLKDTVMVPTGGYTVVRFFANNPGYWLFHCHFEMHSDAGMALLFKIGEHNNFLKPPPNFPKCNPHVL